MLQVNLRAATPDDVPGVTACVCEAYVSYIERIGKRPGPMLEDFDQTLRDAQVYVAVLQGRVVGVVVFKTTEEGFYLDNVAVRPSVKGSGVGRMLLEFGEAEALRQGYNSIYLATHELMHENRALYSRIGYVEYDRRVVNGYPRVFFRKQLE
jgi:GNAT superfamily N-acetyltransferase